jgi:hypothetical protein
VQFTIIISNIRDVVAHVVYWLSIAQTVEYQRDGDWHIQGQEKAQAAEFDCYPLKRARATNMGAYAGLLNS